MPLIFLSRGQCPPYATQAVRSIVSFNKDKIAGSEKGPLNLDNTVRMLIKILGDKLKHKEIEGKHLRPLGIELGDSIVGPIAPPPHDLVPLVLEFLA